MNTRLASALALSLALLGAPLAARAAATGAPADLVFAENGGLVAVEAEHFFQQELTAQRAWHVFTPVQRPRHAPDTDGTHIIGASGGAYLEALPDTRWTHDEKLVPGENFSNEPGKIAVLSYKVHFTKPGRYHFWARIYSTGGEDNGLHVGLNGNWPESGRRWQTIKKNAWQWDSRQRTEAVHVGVPGQLYLDVPAAGEHTVQISMREDGFEIDKWIMTMDANYAPEGTGPAPVAKSGHIPAAFALPAAYQDLPAPTLRPPGASSAAIPVTPTPATTSTVTAASLKLESTGYYLDQGKWAAINPNERKEASVKFTVPARNGPHRIELHTVGENDGASTYEVYLADQLLGRFENPLSNQTFEEGERFRAVWFDVDISEGTFVEIRSRVGSRDGQEWARARWSKIVFIPRTAEVGHGRSQLTLAAAQREQLFRPVPRQTSGDGTVTINGELRQWHKVTLDLAGPFAAETDTAPNPFTGYRFDVTFTHESGSPSYVVPGYFAADGKAAESSATAGTAWRAHLSPDKPGKWNYRVSFTAGTNAATYGNGQALAPYDGKSGSFNVATTNKAAPDFRSSGRLTYRNGHYLIAAGSGQPFLKAGADSPETLLAYTDFDDPLALKKEVPLKTWAPHIDDWRAGDPTWKDGKGKGLIGAINYLGAKGANAISFLTYNAAGDGDNVWPFVARDEKLHYDCSRLDQWGIVFEHAQARGVFLHFKLQENESDDDRIGPQAKPGRVPESLDGGACGPERRLYLRELIARFGHLLALNWNLGEENTQSPDEQRAMSQFIHDTDPYRHLIVIHSFPNQQDKVYQALLGQQSILTGASVQNSWKIAHQQTIRWVRASAAAGRPWVVCNDEQNPAHLGVPPDLGYKGYTGKDKNVRNVDFDINDVRKNTLWGTFMAGGAGVEYYFGYQLVENDLLLEDFRSRDKSWDYCRLALGFFRDQKIPLDKMSNANELVGNIAHDNSVYCLTQPGSLYLVFLPQGGATTLDLTAAAGDFALSWFNPREGGPLTAATPATGGAKLTLTAPSSDDWLAIVRRR